MSLAEKEMLQFACCASSFLVWMTLFISQVTPVRFLFTQVLDVDTDLWNCLNVLDLFRKVPAQHK